jgi:hypothetical protein
MQNKEEEGPYEYAADHSGTGHEAHAEEAQLVQPLSVEGQEGSSAAAPTLALCKAGVEGECARDVMGGCPSRHDPCWKQIRHHGGSANEGGLDCSNRSGCGKGPHENGDRALTEIICFKADYFSGICQALIEPDEAR